MWFYLRESHLSAHMEFRFWSPSSHPIRPSTIVTRCRVSKQVLAGEKLKSASRRGLKSDPPGLSRKSADAKLNRTTPVKMSHGSHRLVSDTKVGIKGRVGIGTVKKRRKKLQSVIKHVMRSCNLLMGWKLKRYLKLNC